MELVSFIGESHDRVNNYHLKDLVGILEARKPRRIIVTMDRNFSDSEAYSRSMKELLESSIITEKGVFTDVDESRYLELRNGFLSRFTRSAEDTVRRNLLEMIDATVQSYLEGYWKDFDTVNSEVTDSLFRAKHRMVSAMFWEMEKQTWNAMLQEITDKINALAPASGDVILVDVEKKYWLLDNLEKE